MAKIITTDGSLYYSKETDVEILDMINKNKDNVFMPLSIFIFQKGLGDDSGEKQYKNMYFQIRNIVTIE